MMPATASATSGAEQDYQQSEEHCCFLERDNIDPELLQELLQDMVADSRRAGEVIRGIRSLVRKDASVHERLNLNAVIADTVWLVSPDALACESVVTTELDPRLPDIKGARRHHYGRMIGSGT